MEDWTCLGQHKRHPEFPVIIDLNDNESAEVAIVENIQRKNLSPIEEAKSYKKLLDRGYLTQDELAIKMGKTQGSISNKLRLLNLSEVVQNALLNNEISERHARSLLRLDDSEEQEEVLHRIITERLNVRDTDTLINSILSTKDFVQVRAPKSLGGSKKKEEYDFDTVFNNYKEEITNEPAIETVDIPKIEVEEAPKIETEETLLLEEETNDDLKEKLQAKIKNFIEELKEEGYTSTYDSYEFDKLYEFIIKIDK